MPEPPACTPPRGPAEGNGSHVRVGSPRGTPAQCPGDFATPPDPHHSPGAASTAMECAAIASSQSGK